MTKNNGAIITMEIPGKNRWVYHLEEESTKEFRLALATGEFKIGTKIQDKDLIKIL